ncbi:MAG: flavodoxin family protein [Candidatus Limnocylindrales bacterium]
MNVLVVYGTQFGPTEHVAHIIGSALQAHHRVNVIAAGDAYAVAGTGVDLLIVGAPTQVGGHRLLVRSFLDHLKRRGFTGVPAAAFDTHIFDTHIDAASQGTGSAAMAIGRRLSSAGCPVVAAPTSFLIAGMTGPMVEGEDARAACWAQGVADSLTMAAA